MRNLLRVTQIHRQGWVEDGILLNVLWNEVWVFLYKNRLLLAVLLVDGLSFVHTVIYDVYKQAHNQEKRSKSFIVELESEILKIWSSE